MTYQPYSLAQRSNKKQEFYTSIGKPRYVKEWCKGHWKIKGQPCEVCKEKEVK